MENVFLFNLICNYNIYKLSGKSSYKVKIILSWYYIKSVLLKEKLINFWSKENSKHNVLSVWTSISITVGYSVVHKSHSGCRQHRVFNECDESFYSWSRGSHYRSVFPVHSVHEGRPVLYEGVNLGINPFLPPFSLKEMALIRKRPSTGKALDPNWVPNEVQLVIRKVH